jgi:hypothetical protein
MFIRGSFVHQKCSNHALTNLLFDLRTSMWVIDLLVNLPSPHLRAPTHPSTPEVLQAKECAPILSSSIIFTFGLVVESIKKLGVHQSTSIWTHIINSFFITWNYYLNIVGSSSSYSFWGMVTTNEMEKEVGESYGSKTIIVAWLQWYYDSCWTWSVIAIDCASLQPKVS